MRPCGGRYLEYPRVPSTSVLSGGDGTTQIILCSLVEENFKGEKNMSTLCNKFGQMLCYSTTEKEI